MHHSQEAEVDWPDFERIRKDESNDTNREAYQDTMLSLLEAEGRARPRHVDRRRQLRHDQYGG